MGDFDFFDECLDFFDECGDFFDERGGFLRRKWFVLKSYYKIGRQKLFAIYRTFSIFV